MDTLSTVNKNKDQVEQHFSWDDIVLIINKFVPVFKDKKYDFIFGIPRGGLIIATLLSYKLNVPLVLDESKLPSLSNVLVVDDIADTGNTLSKYESLGFDSFTIFYKDKSIVKPAFFGEVKLDETWIVFPWEVD
ncbi:hypothetical protein KO361_02915 [Candidatus Woesearchaeota archaeon]|nr:hypothetical protein [Candidatus Woesearchaeota archaeon]